MGGAVDNPYIKMAADTPAWAKASNNRSNMKVIMLIEALKNVGYSRSVKMTTEQFNQDFGKTGIQTIRAAGKKEHMKIKVVHYSGETCVTYNRMNDNDPLYKPTPGGSFAITK